MVEESKQSKWYTGHTQIIYSWYTVIQLSRWNTDDLRSFSTIFWSWEDKLVLDFINSSLCFEGDYFYFRFLIAIKYRAHSVYNLQSTMHSNVHDLFYYTDCPQILLCPKKFIPSHNSTLSTFTGHWVFTYVHHRYILDSKYITSLSKLYVIRFTGHRHT